MLNLKQISCQPGGPDLRPETRCSETLHGQTLPLKQGSSSTKQIPLGAYRAEVAPANKRTLVKTHEYYIIKKQILIITSRCFARKKN